MTYCSARQGDAITPRQMDTLRAYARLGNQKLVAHELGISVQTVKNHLTAVYRKLDVGTVMEAFFALGWVRLPDDVAVGLFNDTLRASELRAELLDIANEAGAIASRLGDLLEGTA